MVCLGFQVKRRGRSWWRGERGSIISGAAVDRPTHVPRDLRRRHSIHTVLETLYFHKPTTNDQHLRKQPHNSIAIMCGSDILLGLLAILFPPLAVWVKRGICSADSLINILLCCKSLASTLSLQPLLTSSQVSHISRASFMLGTSYRSRPTQRTSEWHSRMPSRAQ